MDERSALARDNALPESVMMSVSETYVKLAEKYWPVQCLITPRQKLFKYSVKNII